VKFETVGTNAPAFENGDAKFAISNMQLCELTGFTGIGSPKAQTIRDSGDVCGARNTQFDQEFFGLFRAETVPAYDWRDRIGDFCVADYLEEFDTVHVMRYSTPSSSIWAARAHALGLLHDLRRFRHFRCLVREVSAT
jgi:hypothetical protein